LPIYNFFKLLLG